MHDPGTRQRTRADMYRVFDALNRGYFSRDCFKERSCEVDTIDWMDASMERILVSRWPRMFVAGWGLCLSTPKGHQPREASIYLSNLFRDPLIPDCVLVGTMGHEMLHAWLPGGEGHSRRFRRLERELPGYQDREAWFRRALGDDRILDLAKRTAKAVRNGQLTSERAPDRYPRTIPEVRNLARRQSTVRAASSRLVSLAPRELR